MKDKTSYSEVPKCAECTLNELPKLNKPFHAELAAYYSVDVLRHFLNRLQALIALSKLCENGIHLKRKFEYR